MKSPTKSIKSPSKPSPVKPSSTQGQATGPNSYLSGFHRLQGFPLCPKLGFSNLSFSANVVGGQFLSVDDNLEIHPGLAAYHRSVVQPIGESKLFFLKFILRYFNAFLLADQTNIRDYVFEGERETCGDDPVRKVLPRDSVHRVIQKRINRHDDEGSKRLLVSLFIASFSPMFYLP